MRNIKLTLEYDGSRYNGFIQPPKKGNKTTVSGKITDVLSRMESADTVANTATNTTADTATDLPIDFPTDLSTGFSALFCGERTAPGVHALQQTVNFKTDSALSVGEIRTYLNHYLPQDIVVSEAVETADRFHAELNARSRTYEYRIICSAFPDVFFRKYAHFLSQPLDIAAMDHAAGLLTGKHDFAAFSSGKTKKSTVRELYSIDFETTDISTDNEPDREEIRIYLKANGFLQKMPLSLIGTLLDIGLGKRTPDCIKQIFSRQEDPSHSAVAHALFLKEIEYNN